MGVAWDAGCGDYDSVFCGPEIFVSIAVGGLAAMTLDAALLAWETAPQKTPRAQSTFRLTPVLDVRRRRGLAGVTGRF